MSTRLPSSLVRLTAKSRSTVARCPARRPLHGTSHSRPFTSIPSNGARHPSWAAVTVAAGAAYWTLSNLKPEFVPSILNEVHAEVEPPKDAYIDPTTSTPFPRSIRSPTSGKELRLVGTGVRTVSFLSIRVYSVAFYASADTLEAARSGKIKGFEDYEAARLLPPFPKTGEISEPRGEALIENMINSGGDFAVMIIPLRGTSLQHLRDGFSRALVARLKMPHVSANMPPEASEEASNGITELKSFFSSRNLAKGSPMMVYLSGSDRSLRFTLPNPKDSQEEEVLGTSCNGILAKQLFLSYFSDSGVISEELRKSVAMGLAGEER